MQVDNTQTAIKELTARVQELQPELIVVESTGGYQRAVVNPGGVRLFARADAQMLAESGKKMQPRVYESKSEAGKQLSALLVRRRQLEEMLKAEQNSMRTTRRVHTC